MADISKKLTAEIKRRSAAYVKDKIREPTKHDFLIVENAMIIGANLAAVAAVKVVKKDGDSVPK